jgi:hypothetical protein
VFNVDDCVHVVVKTPLYVSVGTLQMLTLVGAEDTVECGDE